MKLLHDAMTKLTKICKKLFVRYVNSSPKFDFLHKLLKFCCPLIHTNHMLLYNGEQLRVSKNFGIVELLKLLNV